MASTPPPSENDYNSSNAPTPIAYDPLASSASTPIVITSQDTVNKDSFIRWIQHIDPEILQNMSINQVPFEYRDLFFKYKIRLMLNSHGNKSNNLDIDMDFETKGGRRFKSKKRKSKKRKSKKRKSKKRKSKKNKRK
jgi:hypothetical protein